MYMHANSMKFYFRCGPLSHVWCMRYEAKNSYFKKLSQVLGNFKNIASTLANHHQRYMCYHMNNSSYLRDDNSKPLCG